MISETLLDPLPLAQALIRCNSVTPSDGGAIDIVSKALHSMGFTCHPLLFSEAGTPDVNNLYARIGRNPPHLCYAGHTDVVPTGSYESWKVPPFSGHVVDDMLWGRGAADMKGAIACFIAALARFLNQHGGLPNGSISLLITGDEEGPAINGTAKVLKWLADRGEVIDACVVGEPTNPGQLGDMIKIGRRGSLNGQLTVSGMQGHVAYPSLADNPITKLLTILDKLQNTPLDTGTEHFDPSNLEITRLSVDNTVANIIPSKASASFNIRFNDQHTTSSLNSWLHETCRSISDSYELTISSSGDAFMTAPGSLSDSISDAISKVTGRQPALSTAGGTSDARFIRRYCPVVEFGLVGQTMHKVNERIPLSDLATLTNIYSEMIKNILST